MKIRTWYLNGSIFKEIPQTEQNIQKFRAQHERTLDERTLVSLPSTYYALVECDEHYIKTYGTHGTYYVIDAERNQQHEIYLQDVI